MRKPFVKLAYLAIRLPFSIPVAALYTALLLMSAFLRLCADATADMANAVDEIFDRAFRPIDKAFARFGINR